MKKLLALLLAALMVLSLAACSMEGGSSEPAKTEETTAAPETTETETEQPAEETAAPEVKADADITIAVVPKSLDNAIFLDSQAAAEAKANELGINLQWVGPTTSDAGQQGTVIEGLIEKQVDGILISCLSGSAEVTVPDTVKKITNAFYYKNSTVSIVLPSSVTEIGTYAFTGCPKLQSITIPSSVTSIAKDAIYDCKSLSAVYVKEGSYAESWLKDNGFESLIQYS